MLDPLAQGITMRKLMVPHLDSGPGLFAALTTEEQEVTGYHYRPPLCVNLTRVRFKPKTFGVWVTRGTAETFRYWMNE